MIINLQIGSLDRPLCVNSSTLFIVQCDANKIPAAEVRATAVECLAEGGFLLTLAASPEPTLSAYRRRAGDLVDVAVEVGPRDAAS